jgi:hypothetical protein
MRPTVRGYMTGEEDALRISARRFILGVLGGAAAALALYFLFMLPTGIAVAVCVAALVLWAVGNAPARGKERPEPAFAAPRSRGPWRLLKPLLLVALLGGVVAGFALYFLASSDPQSLPQIPGDPGVGNRFPGSDSDPMSSTGSDSDSFLVEIVAPGVVAFVLCAALWEARAFIPRLTRLRSLHAPRVEPEGLSGAEAEELVKSLSTVLATSELSPSERLELVKARVQQAHAAPIEADEPRLPYWVAFGSPVVGMATGVAGVVIALAQ